MALEYLRNKNIAHRDLKPDNVMISDDWIIKLIDFGEAKVVDPYDNGSVASR